MALKTYHGSCHCGAVRFAVDLDLAEGTGRCNCSFCTKIRNWSISTKPDKFRLDSGHDNLADYQFGSNAAHHVFCKTCGVRAYGFGHIKEMGGDYVSIQIACLDDASIDEIMSGPITYFDGRHDNWWNPPADTRAL